MTPQPPKPNPFSSVTPHAGETPTASAQETPAGGAATPIYLAVGARPLPEYQLTSKLGQGGFGEVWRASGPGGFDVALKFLRLGEASGTTELKALQAVKGIRHPNLLSVFGVWEKDGFLVIAMELADRSLLDRLKEAVKQGLPGIPTSELLDYLHDTARGLDFLNEKNIQHRDVKPHNLFLYGRGVKVADFGLAKVLEQSLVSASTKMTPAYAAPEFLNGQASRWSDQYSLAVTYCQLRTNRLPFVGTVMEILTGHMTRTPDLAMLPPAERPIVARALAKEPNQRWPSCRAFIDALTAVQQGSKVSAVVPPPPPLPPQPLEELDDLPEAPTPTASVSRLPRPPVLVRSTPKSSFPLIAVGVLVLLFAAGVGVGVYLWKQNGPGATVAQNSRSAVATSPGPAPRPVASPTQSTVASPPSAPPAKGGAVPTSGSTPNEPAKGSDTPPPMVPPPGKEGPPPVPVLRLTERLPPIMVKAGESCTVTVRLRREHCQGPVTVRLSGLPEQVHAEAASIPADADQATVTLRAGAGAPAVAKYVNLVATLDQSAQVRAVAMFRVEVEPPARTARRPWPVERLLPVGTDLVLHLEWKQFLESSLASRHLREPLQQALRGEPAASLLRTMSFDPTTDLDSITACSVNLKAKTGDGANANMPWEGDGFYILKGRFQPEKVIAVLEADKTVPRTTHGEFTLYEIKATGTEYVVHVVVLDAATLIAGTKELVKEVCTRVTEEKPFLLKLGLVQAMARVRRTRTFWLAAAVPDSVREQIRSAAEGAAPFAAITDVTLHLHVTAGIDLEVEGTTVDDASAVKVKEMVDLGKVALRANPNLVADKELAGELQGLFDRLQITQTGRNVTLRLDFTARLTELLIDLAKKSAGK